MIKNAFLGIDIEYFCVQPTAGSVEFSLRISFNGDKYTCITLKYGQ